MYIIHYWYLGPFQGHFRSVSDLPLRLFSINISFPGKCYAITTRTRELGVQSGKEEISLSQTRRNKRPMIERTHRRDETVFKPDTEFMNEPLINEWSDSR